MSEQHSFSLNQCLRTVILIKCVICSAKILMTPDYLQQGVVMCLSHLGAVITKYHKLGGLETTKLNFLWFWKLGSPKIKAPAELAMNQNFLVHRRCLPAVTTHGGRAKEFSQASFIRTRIPLMGTPA